MSFSPGTRIGLFEITAALGAGGMGEVYRARDLTLHRDVAIKVLRADVAHDPDRLARFDREAQILAALNHPNIGHVYGLERADGVPALVMELVEGETLADRLVHGPIPITESLSIARQIAEGLEAAHERGIVHRDLKPANVKVRDDGTVKVLDFGLAKMGEVAGVHAEVSNSPTLVASLPGTILGTAAYMSPEQAKGKPADAVSDVWAFGCVLYEMLTGRQPFRGDTLAETLSEVLKSDPNWDRLPGDTPPLMRSLLMRCLQKDRKRRAQHIGDVRLEIEEAIRDPRPKTADVTRISARTLALGALAVVILIAATAAVVTFIGRDVRELREVRLDVVTPPSSDLSSVAISPDGEKLAFVATTDSGSQLWIRRLSTGSTQALAAASLATSPFWSPDSQSIGFFAEGKLKRIDIDTGGVQTLANAAFVGEGAWSGEVIVFRPGINGPLFRVAATGGPVAEATRLTAGQVAHSFPRFLPDGRHFLFVSSRESGIHVGDLETGESRRLPVDVSTTPVYGADGHLFFVREETLFGQPFDPARLEFSGAPSVIAQRVVPSSLSVSATGIIAYRQIPVDLARSQLTWVDRSGRELRRLGPPLAGGSPSLSPDGQRVAISQFVDGNTDIYVVDTRDGHATRLTFDPAPDSNPLFSIDGSRILFRSRRGAAAGIYEKQSSGSGNERLLVKALTYAIPNDWSRDGRFLLFHGEIDERKQSETLALAMDTPDQKPVPLTEGPRDEGNAQFSKDGKWIAYQSDETGPFHVYVQPFTGRSEVSGKRQVSLTGGMHLGGAQPRWGRDDKELFYVSLDGWLMAAPVARGVDDQSVDIGPAVPLFPARVGEAAQARSQYVVTSDGQFLMNIRTVENTPPVRVILNWKPRGD